MMQGMLARGQVLVARNMQSSVVIEELLGEGAQAEVYRGRIGNESSAVKWYRPEYLRVDPRIWDRLKVAVNSGSPTEQFLWPFAIGQDADYETLRKFVDNPERPVLRVDNSEQLVRCFRYVSTAVTATPPGREAPPSPEPVAQEPAFDDSTW